MKPEWTHIICRACWKREKGDKTPHRLVNAPVELCCFCRVEETGEGIYLREDPRTLACRGIHEP